MKKYLVDMVIVKLWGGIGNQLFQFVFGQYLHYRYNQEVKYDINTYISVDKLRKREIDAVNNIIEYDARCIFSRYRGVKNRILRYIFQLNPKKHFVSEESEIPSLFQEGDLYFFQGYWQDIKYYEWLRNNVLDFKIESILFPKELDLFKEDIIKHVNSVSLHIRRGDYFLPQNIGVYGVCNSRYYEEAINLIKRIIADVKIYVFTDDIEWVKHNIKIGNDYVIIPNYNISQFAYIELMSLCHHHIISNSSFSWWGAVLNEKEDAVVVSPDRWTNTSTVTIALDKWTKISVVNE